MIIRYGHRGQTYAGWFDGGEVRPLGQDLSSLLHLGVDELRRRIEHRDADPVAVRDVEVLAPVDGRTEVWAAGVTYAISQDARVEESESSADAYTKVYDAERSELFFKSAALWPATATRSGSGPTRRSTYPNPNSPC